MLLNSCSLSPTLNLSLSLSLCLSLSLFLCLSKSISLFSFPTSFHSLSSPTLSFSVPFYLSLMTWKDRCRGPIQDFHGWVWVRISQIQLFFKSLSLISLSFSVPLILSFFLFLYIYVYTQFIFSNVCATFLASNNGCHIFYPAKSFS